MDENLQYRITYFFDWWKQKHLSISNLDLTEQRYEANLLLWGSLDALSNHWAKSISKEKYGNAGKRIIFDAFLTSYGGDLFQLVSLPDVWSRVKQKNTSKLPENVFIFLSEVGRYKPSSLSYEYQDDLGMNTYANRSITDDLSLSNIIKQTLESCPNVIEAELEQWLIYSRYGAIAYKELRNAYIHEGQPGGRTHDFRLYGWGEKPTYHSSIYSTPPIMGFSVEFMLGILKQCIDEFETEALRLQVDPAPPK